MARYRVALAVALCASLAAVPPAGAQTPTEGSLTGTFHVIWGDPQSQRDVDARRMFALFGDDGRFTLLDMSDAQAAGFGGVLALNGRRVTLAVGDAAAGETATPGGAAARLRVRAVQGVEAPAGLGRPTLRVSAMAAGAASSGGVSRQAAGAPAPVSRPYVTILCKFPDFPDSLPAQKSHFQSMISGAYPSVDSYWREVSEERVNLAGSVVLGWYTLPQPRSYYVANNNANLARLADDCTGAADAEVYFPSYAGINLQFNTVLDCCSWGGSFSLNRDGISKVYPMTWEAAWAARQMGTWAHEVGHSFGLPHSSGPYGRTYDSRWDVMSSSSWYTPTGSNISFGTHTVSYHKDLLGWVPASRRFEATGSLARVAIERSAQPGANGNYQLAVIPIVSAPGQFYTVEVRRRVGYDSPLPGDAVVISRVDPERADPSQVVDPDGNGNPNDAGAMWTVGETFVDHDNAVRVTVDSAKADAFYVTIGLGRVLVLGDAGRRASAAAGSGAVIADSVAVSLGGGAGWRAVRRAGWNALTAAGAAGDGWLRWERRVGALGPGVYVDTIDVIAAGAVGSPARLLDTLQVLAAPTLTAGLSAAGRADSALSAARTDSVLVRPSGPGAASAAWSAAKGAAWITLLASSGTGPGVVRWTWSTAGLAPGLYVDTISVAVAGGGAPAWFVDSLRVLPPPAPAAGAPSHRAVASEGPMAVVDSTTLRFADRWATGAAWQASAKPGLSRRFIRVLTAAGTGDGVVRYTRDAGTLPVGTYVDTVFIEGAFVERRPLVVDTLDVVSASLALALSASARGDTVLAGLSQSMDSVEVYLTGTGARSRTWTTVSRRGYVTLMSRDAFSPIGGGTGSGRLRWMRKPAGLAPGVYVDTLVVTAGTLTARLVDTMVVVSPPMLALDEPDVVVVGRGAAAPAGLATRLDDSAAVLAELVYPKGADAAWTATARRPWTVLTTPSGVGSGRLRWSRVATSLDVGTYVDTITVTAAAFGGAEARVVDTLRVVPAFSLKIADLPDPAVSVGRTCVAATTTGAPLRDSVAVQVQLAYPGAAVAWSATASRHAWLSVQTPTGATSGFVKWVRAVAGLAVGTYVDTVTVTAVGIGNARTSVRIIDTLRVVPPFSLALDGRAAGAASSRNAAALAGFAAGLRDSAALTFAGFGASGAPWTATASRGWTHVTTSSGSGGGFVYWERAGSIPAGTYVDTIVVEARPAGGAADEPALTSRIVDTFTVAAAPSAAEAAEELLGAPRLSAVVRQLVDRMGNNDGTYNLGDFLAYLDRTGAKVSAELMARVMTGAATAAERRTPDDSSPTRP